MGQAQILTWSDIEETAMESVGGSVLRRYRSGEELTVARVTLEVGAILAVHSHENEQMSILLSGRLEFIIDGKTEIVTPGQLVYLPAHVSHGVRALEASAVLDVFAPPRTDWEQLK